MADATALGMIAAAIAGRNLRVEFAEAGTLAWTDGSVVHVDGGADAQTQLAQLCVQSALLAAGSLDRTVVEQLPRRSTVAVRYLALEGHRALKLLDDLLPPSVLPLINPLLAGRAESPGASLELARGGESIRPPPGVFGTIKPRKLLAAAALESDTGPRGQHVPRRQENNLVEFAEDEEDDAGNNHDFATSPVGGGGSLGKLLQRMFQQVRNLQGGGTPGADAPTHWSRAASRAGARSVSSAATAETVEGAFGQGTGILYPEWNVHQRCYRPDWCTVKEQDAPAGTHASVQWLTGYELRRPLARLGFELERVRRQPQGDDIDIDAAIEARIDVSTGLTPDEAWYVDSQRQRRDLSVLILLDISGSVAQASDNGGSVHQQQRLAAAALTTVLYEIGDRVALYAFHSQGRSDVHMFPVKRFDEALDSRVTSRLSSLVPGAYSRLGAAIRHASTVLQERSGTSRQLLLLLSDGLAYDHGYEPAYGAADARRALAEARRDGVGCLCISTGANTDTEVLRRVFGSAAFAAVPGPRQLGAVVGPLFRSALQVAEVSRRAA
jgi:hypothetical protein